MSQTCLEDFTQTESEPNSIDEETKLVTKPAEIILEIINISGGNQDGDSKKTRANQYLDNNTSTSSSARPKKITIRITGKTKSISSDKTETTSLLQQQQPQLSPQPPSQLPPQQQATLSKQWTPIIAKTSFSPLTPFKPLSSLKNSNSLDVKNFESFRPIQQQRTDDSFDHFFAR